MPRPHYVYKLYLSVRVKALISKITNKNRLDCSINERGSVPLRSDNVHCAQKTINAEYGIYILLGKQIVAHTHQYAMYEDARILGKVHAI